MEDSPNPLENHSGPRTQGVEMVHRTITTDKELGAAGYGHLEDPKANETRIDIYEHNLAFDGLTDELKTSFDLKDPGHSFGLTSDEAKVRLARDGPNMLTPPKKKSAFRKVCAVVNHSFASQP